MAKVWERVSLERFRKAKSSAGGTMWHSHSRHSVTAPSLKQNQGAIVQFAHGQAAQPGKKFWHCAQQAVPCSQPHPALLWCQQKENSTTPNSGRYPSNLHDIQSLKECTLQKDLVCWHEIKRINPRLFTKIKTTFKEARNPGGSKVFPSSSTFLT